MKKFVSTLCVYLYNTIFSKIPFNFIRMAVARRFMVTNALHANNERIIMNNLQEFFAGRTVVVVAHRLSAVTNAGNIIVLDKGRIIEQGTHQ